MTDQATLPYGRQSIDESDIAAVADVLRGDFLTTGPAAGEFEQRFAAVCGAPHAVVCSSGTAALHLAAIVGGLGPGTAAVVPAMTFAATANTVRLVGAEVVFADVDPDNGLMRPDDFEEALRRARQSGSDVRAVLPVHLGGQTADVETISEIAARGGCVVIEDACHAIGTSYGAHRVGECAHSALAAFSFHPVKTIAMGEGGAVTTRDSDLAERMRRLRNHGIGRMASSFEFADLGFDARGAPNPWYYELPEVGLNYRASDIHCALGCSQLGKLDEFIDKRRALVERYDSLLRTADLPVRRVALRANINACWHLYVVLVDFDQVRGGRAGAMNRLADGGIGTQVHYIPLHFQPYYRRRYGVQSFPGAERYYSRCLSLPLFPQMTDDDVDRVVTALKEVLG